ncbi:hypothetical protein G6F46_003246 [Rhizopus delemar]|uniref:HCP-like protein n=3 Tax=Rhizopus TaxID=4842 RepID=I1BRB2_RHIO9|nr:hypothetical protein RO3G_03447 [Rhizopus delemar RA 99-880]KAG1454461.1 hypothetical protein G6F55_007599 [Rhizopus delemar]KAG1540340.1 hypothetical protein G6F51_008581 [Rhizopus arrhizus]KAG1501981.1 hypothetical protein G6F54_002664 [Rhizopus delemar]KAG1508649.1 hypothetical protein G6F53_008035 [Rhizopus delemar]|eukprot:EIE78742.1 hypothetical protein RO3G_03447 [Rhizopus delemar RA 99-880]
MTDNTSRAYHENRYNDSFDYLTPNSRIIPRSSPMEYHPARTTSLQKPVDYGRESLIDPTSVQFYTHQDHSCGYAKDVYIEPTKATIMIDPVADQEPISPVPNISFFHQHNTPSPQIQTICKPKRVKSNVQYVAQAPLKMQQACIESCEVSIEQKSDNFSLQPAPRNKKNQNEGSGSIKITPTQSTSSNRLPKPPLTPLVIPPTPVRSSSSPVHTLVTPTRTSSMSHQLDTQMTPGSSTPGSSRSAYSPHGLSPFSSSPITPSPNTYLSHTMIPSPLSNEHNGAALKVNSPHHKKQSILPDNAAERLVHQGIKFHEAGKLEQATEMFKQASAMDLPIAMFLYGVSIRHGWGCKKNEHLAFQYLQKAAEHAVEDLESFSNTVNKSASKGELIMAIYELGVSFRHGWGCRKNKETAVYYFKIAADLNDPDAQNDLGHCYYHGHGVKKDLKMAAKYYRMADKQGQGIMGNSWIWKSKYD